MRRRICIAILVMGFSGLVAEILILRELLIVYSGNELCIGIILANWLILEAFGSFTAGNKAESSANSLEEFSIITILFALSLPATIYLIRILKNLLGVSIGESIGFLPMFYSSFLILLPVCILHGALFTYGCRIFSEVSTRDASSVGKVYVYETLGTIVGGVVCTYLLIPFFNTFQASFLLALINFVACLVLLAPHWMNGLLQNAIIIVLFVCTFLTTAILLTNRVNTLHNYSIKSQWKNQNVVHYQNSKYGNICIVENQGQYIFFQDGIPNIIVPIPDIPFVEEFVHLPLLSHPNPEKLMILSGGVGGIINETLKHQSVDTIEYAELDPLLLELLREFSTPLTEFELNNNRVKIKHIDGRLLLKATDKKYDVILLGIREPSNLQANRFFTQEFFRLAQSRLTDEGILVLGLPGSLTYVSDELKDLNSSILTTIRTVFSYTKIVPGEGGNLFLASDSESISLINTRGIADRLIQRNVRTNVVVPYHIEKKLHQGWQGWFSRFLEGRSQEINTDIRPIGLYYSISHWNALYAPSLRGLFKKFEKINLWIIVLLMVVLLLVYFSVRQVRPPPLKAGIGFAIITTGFAGMIFDLVLIFAFQSTYGYVFSWIGLLVASFMAGAACGAMLITALLPKMRNHYNYFVVFELTILCFSFCLPFIFLVTQAHLSSPFTFFLYRMLFLLVSFICGFLISSQFPLANMIYLKKSKSLSQTAGILYGADLLGGWFGGIAGAVILLPVLGLAGTCVTVGLLKLTSFIVIFTLPGRQLWG